MTRSLRLACCILGASCLLTTASSCHYLRSSEKIAEIGRERLVYGPIEDKCLYRLDGKYYMKRRVHTYKRIPEWNGSIFMAELNPTLYQRTAEQGTPRYVYMECSAKEAARFLRKNGRGSSCSHDATTSYYADDLGQTLGYSLPIPDAQFDRQKARKMPIKQYDHEENRKEVNGHVFFGHLDDLRTLKPTVDMPESFISQESPYFSSYDYDQCHIKTAPQPDRATWFQQGICVLDKIAVDYPATVILTLIQYGLWAD